MAQLGDTIIKGDLEVLGNCNIQGRESIPVGTVLPYFGEVPPVNYLICDGSSVSASVYPELARVVPSRNKNGDMIRLPNLGGNVIVGYTPNSEHYGEIGNGGGEETHTLSIDEMPSHCHSIGTANGQGNKDWGYNFTYDNNTAAWHTGSCSYEGRNQPHNNMQPYIILNYIIKVK